MPMKNELLEQFLAGQPQYGAEELQEQLSRFYDNSKIDVSDLKEVLALLGSDHNDKSYIMKIYDITGNFERQAYLLDKARHEGKWSFEHIVVFNILAHCARIEPILTFEKLSYFSKLLEYLAGRKK